MRIRSVVVPASVKRLGVADMRIPGFVDHHAHLLAQTAGETLSADLRGEQTHIHVCGLTPTDVSHPPKLASFIEAFDGVLREAAQHGLVQITEAGLTQWEYYDALCRLRERGSLPLRVRLLVASGIASLDRMKKTADAQLEIEGVKFYADGYLGLRTAAIHDPYTDEPDNRGLLFLDSATLAQRAEPYANAGFTIATHAIGDRAIDMVLDAYEMLFGGDCATARPRIEHAQILTQESIMRMAAMGVVACIQPSFAVTDAQSALRALGPDRMSTAYRWDLLLHAGVAVIGGSDYPVETLDPLRGLRRLSTGRDGDGEPVAVALGTQDALAVMTDQLAGWTEVSRPIEQIATDQYRDVCVVAAGISA